MDWQQAISLTIVAAAAALLVRHFVSRKGRVTDCENCTCPTVHDSRREERQPDPLNLPIEKSILRPRALKG